MTDKEYTWQDVANFILEGAMALPACRRRLLKLNEDNVPVAGCALGVGRYAAGLTFIVSNTMFEGENIIFFKHTGTSYGEAERVLRTKYRERFYDEGIMEHNDTQGRDVVLANIKELLNEDSASALHQES